MKLAPKMLLTATCALALGLPACTADTVGSDAQNTTEIVASPKDGGEVELFRSENDGQFYFRVKATNGEIILASEGYESLGGARNGMQALKRSTQTSRGFSVKRAQNGEYYFNVTANNHAVLATSEMYSTKSNAVKGAKTVMAYLKGNTMVDYWTDQCGFEMYTGADDDTWFRLRARNGEKILKSEGYTSEAGAKNAIDSVVTTSLIAEDGYGHAAYVVFEGEDGQFYWRLQADNGQIVATGGEGFSSEAAARASIELVIEHAQDEIECWTAHERHALTTGEERAPSGDVVGTVEDTFIGEMDPFVVGDVCIVYVQPYEDGGLVGILDEFCDYTLDYSEAHGFAVAVASSDLRPVSDAEDRELQDYQTADYFWLDGSITSVE